MVKKIIFPLLLLLVEPVDALHQRGDDDCQSGHDGARRDDCLPGYSDDHRALLLPQLVPPRASSLEMISTI